VRGFLGTSASLWSDLSLVLTLLFGAVAAFGGIQARRRRFSQHCPLMPVAALLNWIPVLLVMVPRWLGVVSGSQTMAGGLLGSVPVFHGVLGGVTQLLVTYTAVRMRWAKRLPPAKPIWLMRATIGLWALALVGGVSVYVVAYVL
jgi:hypothetical protein